MYCPKCGQPVSEGARFCGACGSVLAEPVNMDAAETVSAEESIVSGYEEGLNAAERTEAPDSADEPAGASVTAAPEYAGDSVPIEGAKAQEAEDIPAGSSQNSPDPDVFRPRVGKPAAGRSGRNNALPVILIAAVIAVIVMVNLIMALLPADKESWQEQYDLGQQYLLELDYEQAIVAFTAAIEIDENNAQAYVARAEAYLAADAAAAAAAEDSSESEAAGDVILSDYQAAALEDYLCAVSIDETLSDAYIGAAELYIITGDYDAAASVIEEGLTANPGDAVLEAYQSVLDSKITAATQRQEIEDQYLETLLSLAQAFYADPESMGNTEWVDDEFREFAQSLEETQLWELENGLVFGVYRYGFIYYGEMEDGQRKGYGIWFLCGTFDVSNRSDLDGVQIGNYIYAGEWDDNYPNGPGSIYEFYVSTSYAWDMTFVNGLGDGTGTLSFRDASVSGSTGVTAENGKLVQIGETEDGSAYYAVIEGSYFIGTAIVVTGAYTGASADLFVTGE